MDKSAFNIQFQNKDLASKIVAGLERISEAYRVLLWDYAKEFGISPIQIQLLIFIKYHPEEQCNVSALALEFNVTKPTISDAVRVLHKKELILKNPSELDRRAYSISLSDRGEEIVQKVESFASPVRDIIKSLGLEQQRDFFFTLSQLISGLHRSGILTVQRNCFSCRFYDSKRKTPYCTLLQQTLLPEDIRIDCPEFEERG